MRPAGRGASASLYFTYPHFDPPAPDAGREAAVQIAIVGGGPVGMVAALTLAAHGVASTVIEAKSTFNDGSRAICVSRSSFHILDQIGAVAPFLEKALGWTTGRSFYRGRQILEFHMPDSDQAKFRPMYNLQQQYIEQFLWQACDASPLIEFRWQSRVTGLTQGDGVVLNVTDPHGDYHLPAAWVLAVDGARSDIRKALGLRLKGENYEGRYVIADVKMAHDYPTIRRALFDPDSRRGGTVLVHRQPEDIWRIDYQLHDDEDAAEALRESTVRASVAAVLRDIGHTGPWELEWWSVYSANTLALDDYRADNVFFIGDAAHIVPIFGVRGLNNGLADAHNIGWKLARVVNGLSGTALLDSYSPERRGATLDVFANASKSARFMTPPSPGWRLMRDAALSLALDHRFAGELANPRQMQPYTYAASPVVLPDDPAFDGGPVPGAVLPDAWLGQGFLTDLVGPEFTLIQVGEAARVDGLARHELPPGSAAAIALGVGPGGAYLIRPDGHIAARWAQADTDSIRTALARAACLKG